MLFSRKARATALVGGVIQSNPGSISLKRHPIALSVGEWVALGALVLTVLVAIVGPWIIGISPIIPAGDTFLPPGSPGHLLGTDNLGMDLLARILTGMRTSLLAALIVTAAATVIGTAIGVTAGFLGGWLDNILMRITDVFLAFPATIVAMAVAAALQPSLSSSMIGITVVWWPLYARLVRGEIRRVMVSSHVEAARVSGVRGFRLLRKHVIPATTPSIAVTASMDIGGVIMTLAALSFIGLGTPAPAPELGRMASGGMQYVMNAWWVPVFPALAVGILALLFNYIGDGVRGLLRSRGV